MKKTVCLWVCWLTLLLPASLEAQVDFSADTTSGCAPLLVSFTSQVPANATSVLWDFGNSGTSTQLNPGRSYTQPGTYTVTLTAYFASGPPQTQTKTAFINVFAAPSVDFSANPTTVCKGDPVAFTSNVTQGTGAITQYIWDFGDGTGSNQANPTHRYSQSGFYNVALTVEDANGCTAFEFKRVFINVEAPDASFTSSTTNGCFPPFQVRFQSAQTFGNHFWSFGNNLTSTTINPSHTYNSTGSFTVTHIIEVNGCRDTVTIPNYINIGQPTAQIQSSADTACVNQGIRFFCNSTTAQSVLWNFGPGQGSSTQCDPNKGFSTPGVYNVSLTLTEPNNCIINASKRIVILPPPPIDFGTPDTFACNPTHTATFTPVGATNLSLLWSFGDNNSSTSRSPTHTYGASGIYTVTLVATDPFGCRNQITKPNLVNVNLLAAIYNGFPVKGCKPHEVFFRNTSLTRAGLTSVAWRFGDGTSSTNPDTVTHIYRDTGFYSVTLIVSDSLGCVDSVTLTNYIQVGDTVRADFMPSDTIICGEDSIEFTNLSRGNYNKSTWFFGDGETSNFTDPIHFFTDTGYMDITLIVEDRGCRDTLEKDSLVYIQPTIGKFDAFPGFIGCDTPYTVTFLDQSIDADRWFWDFGTGNPADTSILQNPQFTFRQEGAYTIKLVAFNTRTGCKYEVTRTLLVELLRINLGIDTFSGCAPLPVNFTDSSFQAIQWRWSFGDGNRALSPNASHVYSNPGKYSVQLVVWNSIGCQEDSLVPIQITVMKPIIRFSLPDTNVCAPHTAVFVNNTTSVAPVVSWTWSFGNGLTSSLQSPTTIYNNPGHYPVQLIARDSAGCQSVSRRSQYIFVTRTVADFRADYPINCPNNPISFTNNSTANTPLLYLWDFGDNTTSLQRSPTKLYPNSGTYPVSLVIEDTIGCRDTLIRPSYITIADPDVSIAADTTQATCPPLLVRFTATPNSPHPFNAWNWDFGNNNSSAVQNPSNLYTVPGKYGVSLIATAASGCADTVLLPDSIILGGPFGSFSFAPQSGCEGQQIAFTTTTTRNTASIAIDANDGNIVPGTIGLPVLHTYQDSGVYIPTMILRDSLGCTVSIPSTSGITIFPTPNVNFSSPDTALCDSGVVRFFDQSTSSTILNNWQWDFGDGGSGTGQTPTHNYRDTGSFPVQLIVTSIHGCVDSLEKPAFVNVRQSPIPVIGLSDTAGCPPFNLLTSDLSPSSNAPIARWVWDFGVPGGRSVQQNADYTYTSPGVYPVTLTIRDQFNCEGTTDTTVQVWTPPAADFIVDGDSFGCAPVTLQFLDRSGTVVDWNWEFGDGGRAIEQNPTHTYKSDGTYSVTLQVTDSNGCVTQVNKPNYIQLDHPIADFTADPLTGCPGLQVTFLDQSQSDTSLVSWLWDFGDSNQGTGTPTQHIYNNSGKFDVSLKVTDFFGCQDSITKPELIDILLSLQPTPPAITRVTVTSDSEVVLDYERYNNDLDDFAYYVIERATGGGNFIPLDSIENIRQVRYRDQGLDTRNNVYCYRLRVVNYCEFASDPLASEPHCSIQLTTTAQTDQIQLNWTPYIGWPSVAEYRIYRVLNYNMSSAQQIAVVPGTVTSFLDTDMFCYDPVTYRIEAIHPSDALNSLSNIDRETPIHFPSPFPMHMVRATVVNDQFVQLNWSIPQTINPSKIRIEKRDGNVFRPLVEFPFDSPPLSYDDLETNVDNQPYEYRAFVVDSCGDLNPVGRTARSIWLTGERTNGRIFLRWTPYKEWEEGVSFYQLEVFNEASGNFEFLDNVTPEDSLYEDTQTDFPQGSYCYRVTAFEEAGTDTFSLSNETCVIIDPEIYTPNAFTPNGDLVNDIFEIKGVFFDNFHLQIWSRWGLKIYESRNMAEGWNGKVNGTADAPEGVYVFIATGTGFNGDPVRKVGTITLIR